jgi:hypothetical protein
MTASDDKKVPRHGQKFGRTGAWPMKDDRELIVLSKTKTLEALADYFKRPPQAILQRASRLGIPIKRTAKGK